MEDASDETRWTDLSDTRVSLRRGWAFKVQPGWGGEFYCGRTCFSWDKLTQGALSELAGLR